MVSVIKLRFHRGLSVQSHGLMRRIALPNWVNTGITTGSYESSSG